MSTPGSTKATANAVETPRPVQSASHPAVAICAARCLLAPAEGALHVRDQDGAHPVQAEAIAGLADDDVLDLAQVARGSVVHRAMMLFFFKQKTAYEITR